jgi:hypothetical protein
VVDKVVGKKAFHMAAMNLAAQPQLVAAVVAMSSVIPDQFRVAAAVAVSWAINPSK